ncbi:MAG TPA: hypothetical protein VM344_08480, partial [Vitreimonas sp.]|nr:hypothetical protein [Vitreimonas sp.]
MLLLVVAGCLMGLAAVAMRTSHLLALADPGLASTPAVLELAPARSALVAGLVLTSVAIVVVGGRWLTTGRAALEALLGTRVIAGRGAPAWWSLRHWQPLVRPAL